MNHNNNYKIIFITRDREQICKIRCHPSGFSTYSLHTFLQQQQLKKSTFNKIEKLESLSIETLTSISDSTSSSMELHLNVTGYHSPSRTRSSEHLLLCQLQMNGEKPRMQRSWEESGLREAERRLNRIRDHALHQRRRKRSSQRRKKRRRDRQMPLPLHHKCWFHPVIKNNIYFYFFKI